MNLGFGELLLIFVTVLLIFGSSKVPQLGDALGRGIKNFKRAISGENEIDVTPKADASALPGEKAPAAPATTQAAAPAHKK